MRDPYLLKHDKAGYQQLHGLNTGVLYANAHLVHQVDGAVAVPLVAIRLEIHRYRGFVQRCNSRVTPKRKNNPSSAKESKQ